MTTRRIGFYGRGITVGLLLMGFLISGGCVSVKESGTKVSAPPPPTTSVAFHSSPNNAEVYVDGEFRGTAPVTLHLAAGTHQVVFMLEGYREWQRELTVVAGNDTRVAATLERE